MILQSASSLDLQLFSMCCHTSQKRYTIKDIDTLMYSNCLCRRFSWVCIQLNHQYSSKRLMMLVPYCTCRWEILSELILRHIILWHAKPSNFPAMQYTTCWVEQWYPLHFSGQVGFSILSRAAVHWWSPPQCWYDQWSTDGSVSHGGKERASHCRGRTNSLWSFTNRSSR